MLVLLYSVSGTNWGRYSLLYLLLIYLIFASIVAYFISNRDILSPWFITNSVFAFSTAVALLNQDTWRFEFNSITFFVILLASICLGLGEFVARSLSSKRLKENEKLETIKTSYVMNIPIPITILVIFSMLIYVILYYSKVGEIANLVGNGDDFATKLAYFNSASAGGYSIGFVFTLFFAIFSVILYFYMYILLNKLIHSKFRKIDLLNLVPIILYFVLQILSSSRSNFIYIISGALAMGYILWRNKHDWKKKSNRKIINIGIVAVLLFFIAFYYLGNLTGKSQHFTNASEGMSVYTGGSIVSLNSFLEFFSYSRSNFGSETIYGMQHLLGTLGGNGVLTETRHLEFSYVSPYIRTNVYTSLRRYLHDYGFVGMCFIQFIIGLFFTLIYLKIKHHAYKNEILAILLYSSIFYPLVMQSIDEKFLTVLLTPTFLVQVLFFYVFYKIFTRKNSKIKI